MCRKYTAGLHWYNHHRLKVLGSTEVVSSLGTAIQYYYNKSWRRLRGCGGRTNSWGRIISAGVSTIYSLQPNSFTITGQRMFVRRFFTINLISNCFLFKPSPKTNPSIFMVSFTIFLFRLCYSTISVWIQVISKSTLYGYPCQYFAWIYNMYNINIFFY